LRWRCWGLGNGLNATLAWAYVGLRVVHSLVQATVNKVMLRFLIFALSSLRADAADGARRHGGVRLIVSLRSRASDVRLLADPENRRTSGAPAFASCANWRAGRRPSALLLSAFSQSWR
jgi:hypothetical protein